MRQIYYTLLMLLRGRGNNATKVISLTLGLFIGILLFACVAFQLSYNHSFRNPEQLYLAYMTDTEALEQEGLLTFGPFAGAIKENFPQEVEDATVFRDNGIMVFYSGKKRLSAHTIWSDRNLYATLGINLLAGKAEDMQIADAIYISRSLADKIRNGEEWSSLIGKELYLDRKTPYIIWGVFEDLPENVDFSFDAVLSMNELWNDNRGGWGYDTSYTSIIRFHHPQQDVARVEKRLPDLMKRYLPDTENRSFKSKRFIFRPLADYHVKNDTVYTMVIVMTVLAVVILLIAAFNYVLISVSSLSRRAKEVGVHKCSGAADITVFRMFLTETSVIVISSVILVGLLMYLFQDFVEFIAAARFTSLFTLQTLWVPVLVIISVFLFAGVLPAALFSSVPVTQVFRRYSERNTWWKQPLLFIQFAGVAFIFGFLLVVLLQYRIVIDRPLGFDPTRVVTSNAKIENDYDGRAAIFKNLNMVEEYTSTIQLICGGYSTEKMDVGEGRELSSRLSWVSHSFLPMMKMRILEGRNLVQTRKNENWLANSDELVVNKTFVERAGWVDNPVGRIVSLYGERFTVVGVVEDYLISDAFNTQEPVALMFKDMGAIHYVRLKEPFGDNLAALNHVMQEVFPTEDVVFTSLEQQLDIQYTDVRRFRDAVLLASIAIFFIALMGLLGYVNDEVQRRSKEVAIRKVNGAGAIDIIRLLMREATLIALPAVCFGSICAYVFGHRWLDSFSEQVHVSAGAFIAVIILLLMVIAACIVLRTWKIANENPVKSIKSE